MSSKFIIDDFGLDTNDITREQLVDKIRKPRRGTALGLDEIPMGILKQLNATNGTPVLYILNEWFNDSTRLKYK